jgi:uncharacterized membrane protein
VESVEKSLHKTDKSMMLDAYSLFTLCIFVITFIILVIVAILILMDLSQQGTFEIIIYVVITWLVFALLGGIMGCILVIIIALTLIIKYQSIRNSIHRYDHYVISLTNNEDTEEPQQSWRREPLETMDTITS